MLLLLFRRRRRVLPSAAAVVVVVVTGDDERGCGGCGGVLVPSSFATQVVITVGCAADAATCARTSVHG
jgi:hypothetical protein